MLTKYALIPQAVVISYSTNLRVLCILTPRLYTSRLLKFPQGKKFLWWNLLQTVPPFTTLSDCHCANRTPTESVNRGDFDMIEVITPGDNNPILVLFSTSPQNHLM